MTDFQKPKRRSDGKRHDCKNKNEGCNGGTNQGHRTCPICLQKKARVRNNQTAIEKEKKQNQARKTFLAENELRKDLVNYTPKSKRKNRGPEYRKTQQQLLERFGEVCRGCGIRGVMIHTSHRVPEKELEGKAIVNDIENLDLVCDKCHEKVENADWDGLLMEEELHIYIRKVAPEYYKRKLLQQTILHEERIKAKQ